jgi:hypothetical protein
MARTKLICVSLSARMRELAPTINGRPAFSFGFATLDEILCAKMRAELRIETTMVQNHDQNALIKSRR